MIKNLFKPLTKVFKFFTLDYEGQIDRTLELEMYEAKLRYIQATQKKQYWDSILQYEQERLITLEQMVKIQKGTKYVQTTSLTTVSLDSIAAKRNG